MRFELFRPLPRQSRITLEALPSDTQGNLCALLLMKPHDELARAGVDPSVLRAMVEEEFPQFSPWISHEDLQRLAAKPASSLPAFRFAGPRLHVRHRTLILGDAAHTVKPYYGLGANSALEDVVVLGQILKQQQRQQAQEGNVAMSTNKNKKELTRNNTSPYAKNHDAAAALLTADGIASCSWPSWPLPPRPWGTICGPWRLVLAAAAVGRSVLVVGAIAAGLFQFRKGQKNEDNHNRRL